MMRKRSFLKSWFPMIALPALAGFSACDRLATVVNSLALDLPGTSPSPGARPIANPLPTPVQGAPQGQPDLVVTSISLNPANPSAGQAVTYSATVRNQGSGATPAGTVIGVLFTTDGASHTWSDTYSNSLAPGASVTLTANGGDSGSAWSATSGSHSVVAFVNDVTRFPESDMSNNQLTRSFTIGSSGGSTTGPSPTPTSTSTPTPTPSSSSSAAGPYGQDPSLYTLSFSDEFDGSSLDTTKWNDHPWWDNSPLNGQDYGVSGGSLKIWPQPGSDGKFHERILTTYKKYQQTYGYFEVEAKLPIGKGAWPGFWLLNSDNPPNEPEIDIMEAYSGDDSGYWADSNHHPIRYDATFFQTGAGSGGQTGHLSPYTGDLSTGFHKYGLKWEASQLTFYFDGKAVFNAQTTMGKPMYILLDMQYGLENPYGASGYPDSTTPLGPSNSFEIHYVRAWKLN